MAVEINEEILIHAVPAKVWAVLTNFEKYPSWNPFIRSLKGKVETGKTIEVRIQPTGDKGMTFKPKILRMENEKELAWLGHLIFPGLFDGEHSFTLTDNKNGTTTFHHREKFTGILVPLFKKQLENNTTRGFKEMNEKLKELAEQKNS